MLKLVMFLTGLLCVLAIVCIIFSKPDKELWEWECDIHNGKSRESHKSSAGAANAENKAPRAPGDTGI